MNSLAEELKDDTPTTPSPSHEPGNGEVGSLAPGPATLELASPPPDGGLWAWLAVAAGFAIFMNTWGLISTYGVFQTYYESGILFHSSASDIAWIGSLQASLTFFTCVIAGPIFDRGYLRQLLLLGSFLVIFGFMMVSLCKELWQLILAQGFCIGLGSGALYSTVAPTLSQYFRRRLGLANGAAAAGSAFGGIIYPIAFHNLIPMVGFPWATRILGFIALGTLIPPLLFLRLRFKPAKPREFLDGSILRDYPFVTYMFGQMLAVIGLYTMLFYVPSFAISRNITSDTLAFYLLPILNGASLLGRFVPNVLADKFGALNVAPVTTFVCAILLFCMISIRSTASLVVMASLFGFFSGAFVSLPGMALVVLTKDKSRVGTRIGMSLALTGFGALAGGPGGGSVLQDYSRDDNWTSLFVYGGTATTVSGILYLVARALDLKEQRLEEKTSAAQH